MKKVQAILILLFSGILFVSCDSATTQDLSPVVTNPTYTKNVAPVMNANCVICHSNGSQYPNLSTFAEVKDATLNGNVLCRISGFSCGNIMPQSGALPQATVAMITTWATNQCPE